LPETFVRYPERTPERRDMDAPHGMNEHQADQALRDLFREVGGVNAPEGLDARILQRIAVLPAPRPLVDKPLLPKWAWGVGVVLLIALVFTRGGGQPSAWRMVLPAVDISTWFSSPWLTLGLGSLTALLALEASLVKRRSTHIIR
jgi:hypothetical protein